MNHKIRYLAVVAAAVLCLTACGRESYFQDVDQVSGETEEDHGDSSGTESGDKGSASEEGGASIFVQVAGAVKNPGVYELQPDSRVFAAIELAGGLAKDADESDLNQASILQDGQKLYIFKKGEKRQGSSGDGGDVSPQAQPEAADDGKVNINTAGAGELMSLSGIGEAKAQAIIAYRESNGGFTKPEDIMNVDGIAEGTFGKIKDQIKT